MDRTKLTAALLAASLLASGCSSKSESSSETESVKPLAISDLKDLNDGESPEIEYDPVSGGVRSIEGKVSTIKVGDEDDVAEALEELADIIGISAPDNELRFRIRNSGKDEFTYCFDQYYKDVHTFGTVALSVDKDGNVTRLLNRYVPNIDIDVTPNITGEQAVNIAKSKYEAGIDGEPELTLIRSGKNFTLVWHIYLTDIFYPDEVYINAKNGNIDSESGPIPD